MPDDPAFGFERFTERARRVIILAREEAGRFRHDFVGTEHVLLGLIRDGEGIATAVLQRLGLRLETVKAEVERALAGFPKTLTTAEVPFTPQAQRVLKLSIEEARQLGHDYIGPEHLLLGLMKEGQSIAAKILESLGARLDEVRQETLALLGDQYYPRPKKHSQTPVLDEFARDLTQLARETKLDPVIGRDEEIRRVIQVLFRRDDPNPLLIGETGIDKIVEGLAQRIAVGHVPEPLNRARVIALDVGALVADTNVEARLEALLKELTTTEGWTICFIDELHGLLRNRADERAANALKYALLTYLVCIGTTTHGEYHRLTEKHPALARRFRPIMVRELSVAATIENLRGVRHRYEGHHRVKIVEAALVAATELASQWNIPGRSLLSKAIDLLDEAASRVRIDQHSVPEEIIEIERQIERCESDCERYREAGEEARANELGTQLSDLKEQSAALKAQWEVERRRTRVVDARDIEAALASQTWSADLGPDAPTK